MMHGQKNIKNADSTAVWNWKVERLGQPLVQEEKCQGKKV